MKRIDPRRLWYANKWDQSAQEFLDAGCYDWCRSFIKGKKRVLEIGVGSGKSTYVLLRHGHSVVGLEENPACIATANKFLKEMDFDSNITIRGKIEYFEDGDYVTKYDPVPDWIFTRSSCELIESNIFEELDPFFEKITLQSFDAVICWFIGVNGDMERNYIYKEDWQKVFQVSQYRIDVQRMVTYLAKLVLNDGGVLHFVDRTYPMNGSEISELGRELEEIIFAPEGFRLTDLSAEIVDFPNNKGIQYTDTEFGAEFADPNENMMLLSCLARKNA